MNAPNHFPEIIAKGSPQLPNTPFRFVLHFVDRRKWSFLAMFFLSAANSTCSISIPYSLSKIIKAVTHAQSNSLALVDTLTMPIMLFMALSLGEVLFARIAGTIQVSIGPRQRQDVTRETYAYLQQHSHNFFSSNFSGALAHRVSEMSQGVNMTLWAIINDFLPVIVTFSVSFILLFSASHKLALLVGAWGILFIGFSFYLALKSRPYSVKAAAARSETTGRVVDSVTNLTSAKLFARLGFERNLLENTLTKEMTAIRTSLSYAERIRWFQFISSAVLKVGVLYYSLVLWGQGEITVAEFVMATSTALLIIGEARNLSRRFLEFFEFIGNVTNGVNTILRSHGLVDKEHAKIIPIEKGEVVFDKVYFGYSQDKNVFENLSVKIPAGQRVGLVGTSGSGKSTFVSLILRMHDIQRGHIRIDGHDVRDFTQESLHTQLSLIPQDPSLFHRTLLENIRYGRIEASDDDVYAAAHKANAHEFILGLPENYQSLVGERGVKLSGGQRQRIAIARLILKNAPILILDEATSSLDSITEQTIQRTLDVEMRGKTVVVVAHRLSTIAHLDRILVFSEGKIVEDGTHEQLLAKRGAYATLWNCQADGFLNETASPLETASDDSREDIASQEDIDENESTKKDVTI